MLFWGDCLHVRWYEVEIMTSLSVLGLIKRDTTDDNYRWLVWLRIIVSHKKYKMESQQVFYNLAILVLSL